MLVSAVDVVECFKYNFELEDVVLGEVRREVSGVGRRVSESKFGYGAHYVVRD